MSRKYKNYEERHFETAEELWDALSPARFPCPAPCNLIFRGQASSEWQLTPSVLRKSDFLVLKDGAPEIDASEMVFLELSLLATFVKHCDTVGIPVPNDSQLYRLNTVNTQTADRYYKVPPEWPNEEILDLMAMAQHHGVPTRALDWTRKAYAAAYFAASSSLADHGSWTSDTKLAIWILNIERIGLHRNIKLHYSPGSTSRHLAAQGGLFTIHPHNGYRGSSFEISGLENLVSDIPDTVLFKYTLPSFESGVLLKLCERSGFSAAHVYPSADGAGKAVIDGIKYETARNVHNIDSILVR